MIDKAIEEFKHQFCDWNKPSIFVNSKTQPKMDFLRKKLEEMREACAKVAENLDLLKDSKIQMKVTGRLLEDANHWKTRQQLLIAEAIRKVE